MKPIYYLLLLGFFSCKTQRYIYAPTAPNIPYFTEKGNSKLSVLYSEGSNGVNNINQQIILPEEKKNNGLDIQAAYAISNQFALISNYATRAEYDTYGKDYNIFDTSFNKYKRFCFDVGAGFFIPLNKRKTLTYNIYGGLGLGNFKITDNGFKGGLPYERIYKSNTIKYFLQGGFNFMPSPYFRFSFSGKFSFVHFQQSETSYTNSEIQYFYFDKISNNTITFFEPTFNMQLGVPKVQWLKIEGSLYSCSGLPNDYPAVRGIGGSIGLTVDINQLFKKN
jgi:hypothetical protein